MILSFAIANPSAQPAAHRELAQGERERPCGQEGNHRVCAQSGPQREFSTTISHTSCLLARDYPCHAELIVSALPPMSAADADDCHGRRTSRDMLPSIVIDKSDTVIEIEHLRNDRDENCAGHPVDECNELLLRLVRKTAATPTAPRLCPNNRRDQICATVPPPFRDIFWSRVQDISKPCSQLMQSGGLWQTYRRTNIGQRGCLFRASY